MYAVKYEEGWPLWVGSIPKWMPGVEVFNFPTLSEATDQAAAVWDDKEAGGDPGNPGGVVPVFAVLGDYGACARYVVRVMDLEVLLAWPRPVEWFVLMSKSELTPGVKVCEHPEAGETGFVEVMVSPTNLPPDLHFRVLGHVPPSWRREDLL